MRNRSAMIVAGVLAAVVVGGSIALASGSKDRTTQAASSTTTSSTLAPFKPIGSLPPYQPPPECLDPSPTMTWADSSPPYGRTTVIDRAEFCRRYEEAMPPPNSTLVLSVVVSDGELTFLYHRAIRTVSGGGESLREGEYVLSDEAQEIIADERRQNAEASS